MSNSAIKAEGLGKMYSLGGGVDSYPRLSEKISNFFVRGSQHKASKNEFWALRDVSFEIKHGDRTAIVGHNGAGKSTLLKLLSRITSPTKGKFSLSGRVASLLEVGTGFHPELTGRENIFLNGAILGMSQAEVRRKLDEIVAFAEVDQFLDTPVKRYSSGMYVRLAFAVAAHLEPEILIVDEVLAVGDAQFQKKCLGKMEAVGSEGRTVVFVSHNMGAVRKLCNRGILLEKGKVAQIGSADEIATSYFEKMNSGQKFEPINIPEAKVTVQNILINRSSANIATPFEVMEVEIELFAEAELEQVGVQILISKESIDGVLFFSNTKNIKNISAFVKRGLNKIKLRIDNLGLSSGSYSLGFGLDIPNVKWLYYNTNVLGFTVQEAMNGNLPSLQKYSHFYMPHEWSNSVEL